MPVTKEDINKLLKVFIDDDWVKPDEADEIRQYLFSRIDNNTLDVINLEVCFDEDYMICSPSTLWDTLEEIWND